MNDKSTGMTIYAGRQLGVESFEIPLIRWSSYEIGSNLQIVAI